MSNQATVKRLGNGRRSYRNITIRRDDSLPQGHWGHWVTVTAVNGHIIRTGRLDDMTHEIDSALFAAMKARAEAEIAAKALIVRKNLYAATVTAAPSTPWHVEWYAGRYAVYPSPDVNQDCRMPVAEGIGNPYAAKLMAMAPEMLNLLRDVARVMVQGGPDREGILRRVSHVIDYAESPPPDTPSAAQEAQEAALRG